MIQDAQLNLGDWLANKRSKFRNRTGATLIPGQVAMLDLADSESGAGGINIEDDSVFSNLVTVTQAGANAGYPIMVLGGKTNIVDDDIGDFWIWGPRVPVAVLDDDVSTTDVDQGEQIAILVAESATAVQSFAVTDSRLLGIAHEDAAASTDGDTTEVDATAHRRFCLWTGGIPLLGRLTP